jgi:hypothetical protein
MCPAVRECGSVAVFDARSGYEFSLFLAVLRIQIWIRMLLGLLDPDSLVRGMDTDPSIIKQK